MSGGGGAWRRHQEEGARRRHQEEHGRRRARGDDVRRSVVEILGVVTTTGVDCPSHHFLLKFVCVLLCRAVGGQWLLHF